MNISFYVSGDPKAQPRPKAFARNMGGKYVARVYTPGTAEGWKSAVAEAAKKAGLQKFTGAVSLDLRFNFKRPKSHFRSNGRVKESAPFYHTQKPDADNCYKAVADCLTVVGAWDDDSQVADVRITKNWEIGLGTGGCHITIAGL
jgi:Holliday junction resolvase RusA-like endonuclease